MRYLRVPLCEYWERCTRDAESRLEYRHVRSRNSVFCAFCGEHLVEARRWYERHPFYTVVGSTPVPNGT